MLYPKNIYFFLRISIVILNLTFNACYAQNKFVDSLINWVNTHPKIDSQYIQTLHRISYRLSEKDISRAFAYYERVSALSDSLNFTFGKSLAQINLGILLYNSGNYESSNNANFKAIEEAEACGALRLKAVSLNNIGENFKVLKDYERCRQYVLQALPINLKLKAWRGVAINYELLFTCYFSESQYDKARSALQQGLPYAKLSNESYILSQYFLDYGKLMAIEKKPDVARYYFDEAIKESLMETDLRNQAQAYIAEAKYLPDIAWNGKKQLLSHALQIAKKNENLEMVSDASQQLSMLYDSLKNKDSSLFYYRVYRSAADSIFSENNRRNTIIRESEWMIRRKEIENQNLKQLALLQNRQIQIKNSLLYVVIVSLLATIAFAVLLYKSIQSRKKRKEHAFNQKIAETEMQVLRSQMNPHFIFNCLNAINHFILNNETEIASDYLTKFSRLIRMVLQGSSKKVISLADEIETLRLYIELEQVRFKKHFQYTIDCDETLDIEAIMVPPLLLQPFVENAIWHGLMHKEASGLLVISIEQEGNSLCYTITDNGIGRQKALLLKSKSASYKKSMGMQITANRLQMLNIENKQEIYFKVVDLNDENGESTGTKVIIKIPLKLTEPAVV